MNTITLEYGGVEKEIYAGWNFSMPKRTRKSRVAGTFKLTIPNGDPAAAAAIPFEGQVKIFANRVGAGTAWGGGTCIFQGKRTDRPAKAGTTSRNVVMTFSDAWYDLERTPFQQQWYKKNSGDVTAIQAYFTRIYLWHDVNTGGLMSSDAQLLQIINFAATECGVPIQAGQIDPFLNYPIYPTKALSCSDAIRTVLHSMPDVTTSIDYTTTPPTLNIRQRAQLGSVLLPYATSDLAGKRRHETLDIRDRPDLQAPSIILQYQTNNTIDGVTSTAFSVDHYGVDSTGFSLRDMVVPIDLRGFKESYLTGQLTAKAIDPTTSGFWTDHKHDLSLPQITALSVDPDSISIVDAVTGDPVSLDTLPNELLPGGNFAPWMKTSGGTQIVVQKVKITGTLTYQNNVSGSAVPLSKAISHPMSVTIKLTNSEAATDGDGDPIPFYYTTLGSLEEGEVQPTNLAYAIWCSINNVPPNIVGGVYVPPLVMPALNNPSNLQWEGTHVVREDNITLIPNDVTLNLTADPTTGNAPWEAMNATIYEIEEDFFEGTTTVNFGPHKTLTPEQFFEQVMLWRYRLVLDNPNIRSTGVDSSTGGQSISIDAEIENTNHSGVPPLSLDSVSFPVAGGVMLVQKDAVGNGGQIRMAAVDATGTKIVGTVDLRAAIGDVPTANVEMNPPDGLPIIALRQFCVTMPDNSAATAYLLGSYPKKS